jgi:hypothetical protein
MRYGRGRGVSATSGGYAESRSAAKATGRREIPWLKIMIAIMLVVMLIILYLVMNGFTL